MYEGHWGLSSRPFENTPDPAFFYRSPQHDEAFGRLVYAIEGEKGAALLSGVFGCGKTLITRTLFTYLDHSIYKVVVVNNPRMTSLELLMGIATKLGARNLPATKGEVLKNVVWDVIDSLLQNNSREGKKSIVIIDEAHAIQDPEIFEEMRLLLNFQADDRFYLTLLLVGQPEIREMIASNKQLAQRIAIGYHLDPLQPSEVVEYIRFRMEKGGATRAVFTNEAVQLIYSYSGGIPRRINQICDISLLTGLQQGSREVTAEIVKEGVANLGV